MDVRERPSMEVDALMPRRQESREVISSPGEICGLICFDLQAIVLEGFFLEQFLTKTSDILFQRLLRSKLKHTV